MALLCQPRTTPPGGYVYHQKETQTRIESRFHEELIDLVIAHRSYKGLGPLDRESVWLDIQRQICEGQEPGICRGEAGETYKPLANMSRRLTLDLIESFSAAALRFIRSGLNFVSEEVAVARGTICLGCPYNQAPNACSCAPLWRFLERMIPSDRRRANLHVCGICGCAMQAKVLCPDDVIRASELGMFHRYPDHCWIPGVIQSA